MATIPDALAIARQHHLAGHLQEAEQIYRQILAVEPNHADALHLLGVLAHQVGEHLVAVATIERAIGLKGNQAAFHNNLGEAYRALRRWSEAVACYRRGLELDPAYAEAHYNLGIACREQGQLVDAVTCYRRALELKPDYVEAHNNLGSVLQEQGKLDEAVACYRQALELQPAYAQAHCNLAAAFNEQGKPADAAVCCRRALELQPGLAEAHYNLGHALKQQGKLAEAIASYSRALAVKPECAEMHNHLGNALLDQGELDQAIACYRRALELKPDFADAFFSQGNAFKKMGRLDEAIACYRRAIDLQLDYPQAHNNLGIVLADQKRFDEAVACYRRAVSLKANFAEAYNNLGISLVMQNRLEEAISAFEECLRLEPTDPDTHMNLGMACLKAGDLDRGWREYEWRCKRPHVARTLSPQPTWDGFSLEGRTILLWAEQGFGDTIQFIRYAPLVKDRGGIVLVEAPAALLPLLARCPGIDRLHSQGQPRPNFAVQASLLSLPAIFGTNLTNIPAEVPYLSAEPARLEQWRGELLSDPAFNIGIAWQGNRSNDSNRYRSIPLKNFEPLARLPGVRLYSLQKGYGSEQLAAVPDWGVIDLSMRLDEQQAFLDTAAVMRHLDLVVASDSSLVHLAGALAVPVWVPLSEANEWRWMQRREDSPWYPTLRLFRQRRSDDWQDVFARIAEEVQKRVSG